ncbi:class I SAM-dependent methyltransferase [Sideroxydans lithotrophicus]|uniref:Cyclopropane-fatty-acyl-phospholipid synthase n=1 Tax=Sideroxydans lithotrophicus (strain ES-1) TaxID=580332 RepID=D5CT10_SIDLE|nr:class I SAM-dependent methyltransferase [Sideroxydans lithotrophicus]ADE12096.1 Cyclopropane-fatty-acyl-phospholipid synthase [Sideroxydans lithotrophicus ES-1]
MADTYQNSISGRNPGSELAKHILARLFRNFEGSFLIRLWDGSVINAGRGRPEFSLTFRSSKAFQDMVMSHHPLRVVESYFQGLIDVDGDLYSVLKLRHYLASLHLSLTEKAIFAAKALMIKPDKTESQGSRKWAKNLKQKLGLEAGKELNRDAISFHYDVSNDFYALWLDQQMVYSCAYYEEASQSLEQAQCNKLDHICRKLRLKPGEWLLDIGCGWGALICWAAEHYGVNAHGITLSRKQYDHAQRTINRRGLGQKVTVELMDYRDLKGEAEYDKLASVGMFEHVGLKNLPAYFAVANRVLKPGGLFLNHGITSDEGGWKKSITTEFINRYVFPDGQLETISTVQQIMEDAKFEIHDVEGLRHHYALTLREWVRRLEQHHEEAISHVSEPTYRIWRFYMAACAQQFEEGHTGLYQILASKRMPFSDPVPLTRRDLYTGHVNGKGE